MEKIAEYKPGKLIKGAIKLSSNENPLGLSLLAVRAVLESVKTEELKFSIYPWDGTRKCSERRPLGMLAFPQRRY